MLLWPFIFTLIFGLDINETNKNNNKYKNINNEKRKLESYRPISITIDSGCLYYMLRGENEALYNLYMKALNSAKEIITKLVKVKNEKKINATLGFDRYFDYCDNDTLLIQNLETDLLIRVRTRQVGDSSSNFQTNIIKFGEENRPTIGNLIIDAEKIPKQINPDDEYQIRNYTQIFLHSFTHILGFTKSVLDRKGFIKTEPLLNRIDSKNNQINKLVINTPNIIEMAKKYYNCYEANKIKGIELDTDNHELCSEEVHWEGRILLGEYMTSTIYFPEQVISEFTLTLLEELGWYKINHYTGGLMKFGKNKGCDFLTKDCVQINNGNPISYFSNEFCSYDSISTCSAGRISRGYCFTNTIKSEINNIYWRNNWNNNYGIKNVEYCPISFETETNKELSYLGNCNIGKTNFGIELHGEYGGNSENFGELLGNNSFCALSSIVQNGSTITNYQNLIRPTCYSMSCSSKSLTIQLYSKNKEIEYIVCPRKGGLIKIGGKHSNFNGYLFCPDYNLICTGSTLCNDLINCIEKNSTSNSLTYDYTANYISNEIRSGNETNTEVDKYKAEGFEESNNGICPQNCSQCKSHKRCTLCRKFNDVEPFSYYIGEKDDEESHINCTAKPPSGGYYNITKNDYYIHFFSCIKDCNVCINPYNCQQCLPTHKIKKDDYSCIDKIPFCLKYNETNYLEKDPENGGGKGYIECLHCDNSHYYFCVNMNKNACVLIDDYNNKSYYKMEDNKEYSCVQKCDQKFEHCLECVKNKCNICDKGYFVNSTGHCQERIPHCITYRQSSIYTDLTTNGGGDGYRECEQCDEANNYFCINDTRTSCLKIEAKYKDNFYIMRDDEEYPCLRNCSIQYPYCLRCDKERCSQCITQAASNGSCLAPIWNCLDYEKLEVNNIEYLECKKCAQNASYYCENDGQKDDRSNCKYIEDNTTYYKINETDEYSCIRKCEDLFRECKRCNKTECFECKEGNVLSNINKTKCLPNISPAEDDKCTVEIHEIDKNINEFNIEEDLIDFYFINRLSYTKFVDHFVNENYTVTFFIYSECTEDLLNQGYFKIDSTDLYNQMYKDAKIESNELLFSVFITYNYQNYYTFYNIYTEHINETKVCPTCHDIPYTITNKYTATITNVLGPLISSLIESEKIDIFSKDSEIFTDFCSNLTLKGVDIPLDERLNYLYLNDYSTQIACTGIDCIIKEIDTENSISICECKMGNKFEDILYPKIEFSNYNNETSNPSNSIGESFKMLKCASNGFNKKNISANGGFFIALIVIILEIACIIIYCICSKAINLEKGANPPSKKLKNQIFLECDWQKKTRNLTNKADIIDNDIVQPRDEDEENFTEEDLTFTRTIFDDSYSIDTEIGIKKQNEKIHDKDSEDINKGLSEKKSQKILVLLSNKKKGKKSKGKDKKSDSSEEFEFIPTDDIKKRAKKNFCQIYWVVLSIKQHIINYFSSIKCCKITDTYIPLPIRFIRSLFLIVLSFILNTLFLTQKYFSKKFNYFNGEYKLLVTKTDELNIELDEITDSDIPTMELWKYAFNHTIVNAIIVFIILIVVQLIIGIIFFSLRSSVMETIRSNNLSEIKNLITKVRIKYIVFIIISFVLLVLFMFSFIGFGGAYGGSFPDYFIPGLVAIAILEIFPFIWSLILAIFRYVGIRTGNKCCYEFSQFFLF